MLHLCIPASHMEPKRMEDRGAGGSGGKGELAVLMY